MANDDIRVRLDCAYGSAPEQAIDLFCPEHVTPERPLLVLLPGGWWRDGHRRDGHAAALRLAAAGHPCACLGHRPLPTAGDGSDIVADCDAGIVRGLEESAIVGGTERHLVLLAAGTGAVPALALTARADRAYVIRGVAGCGALTTLTPWDGCDEEHARQLAAFAGGHATELDPMQLEPDAFPPVLLIHGDADAEIPVAPTRAFYRTLLAADDPAQLQVLAGVGQHLLDAPDTRGGQDALHRIRDWLTGL